MMNERNVLQNNDEKTGKKMVAESMGSNVDEQLQKIYFHAAMCVCSEDVQPKSMLELANILNPSLDLDVNILKRYCLKIYEDEKAKFQKKLGSFEGQVCLSVDVLKNPNDYDFRWGWSDMMMRYGSYMCVRIHFIDENWKLRMRVIQFDLLEDLWPKDIILKCFQEFDIANKISVFMVHDTFEDIDTCEDEENEIIGILNSKILGKEMPKVSGPIFRAPCCASLFRVMVEEAFEKIEEIISKMQELYSFGRSYPQWHIKLGHIKSTMEMKDMGEFDSDSIRKNYKLPSDEEWKRAKDVCRLVGYVQKAAEVFYETKNATASLYLYNLQKLRVSLIKESVSPDQFVSKMALNMLEKLYKYWKDAFMILAFATVLDPRCKLKYIEFVLSKYEGDAGDSQIQLVHDAFHSLFNEYVSKYPVVADFQEDDSSSSDADSEEDYPLTEKEKEMRDNPTFGFDNVDEYNQFVQSRTQPRRSELDYLEEPVLPWNRNINLMSYWRTASLKYPTLGRMAKDILAIPLSLSDDFDAYFTDFRPADNGVIGLKPNLRNALMCTRSWIKPKRVPAE